MTSVHWRGKRDLALRSFFVRFRRIKFGAVEGREGLAADSGFGDGGTGKNTKPLALCRAFHTAEVVTGFLFLF